MREPKYLYEFGPFRLDPAERLLMRGGNSIPLSPKAFETLLLLVENSGHLLKKDELMKRVWPDAFVEEANLALHISAIRRALDDRNGGEEYIQTVPKIGYRFSGQARRISDPGPTAPTDLPVTSAVMAPGRGKRYATLVITTGAMTLVTAGLLLLGARTRLFSAKEGAANPARIRSIAVLPLVNLSADPAQEYFSDGLTDELITKLAQVGSLQVISRTSVMGYKHTSKKVPEIGRDLHVDSIVEGTVERVGDR